MDFQKFDPYDPNSNPLGFGGLRGGYLDAATAFVSGEIYSDLLLEQENLDTRSLAADLAVQVAACQNAMRSCASTYLRTTSPDLIKLFADASNFAALMAASNNTPGISYADCAKSPAARQSVVSVLDALADQAGQIGLDVTTGKTHLEALQKTLTASAAKLDKALASAVTALGKEAVDAGKEIDRLNAAVAKNISAIVEGGNEAGGAVADLVVGVLTQFSKAAGGPDKPTGDKTGDKPTGDKPTGDKPTGDKPTGDKPTGDKPTGDKPTGDKPAGDKPTGNPPAAAAAATPAAPKVTAPAPKPEGGETPNVEFVVKAIRAGSAGVAKYSTAVANIELDNKSLAVAYQQLATFDVLVAVAKASQAQKDLFCEAVAQTAEAVQQLAGQWAQVRKNLTAVRDTVQTLELGAGGRRARPAGQRWRENLERSHRRDPGHQAHADRRRSRRRLTRLHPEERPQ